MPAKKVPTKIKKVLGTENPFRTLKDEFEPMVLLEVPPPSKVYTTRVQKTWNKIATELLDAGILYALDIELIEQYCDLQTQYDALLENVNKNGVIILNNHGNEGTNPALVQLQSVTKVMLSIGAVLGLGAANRTKIGGAKPKEKNSLRELLKSKPNL